MSLCLCISLIRHGYQRGRNSFGDGIDSDAYDALLATKGQDRVDCAHPLSEARVFSSSLVDVYHAVGQAVL